jgi:hypothetical protein
MQRRDSHQAKLTRDGPTSGALPHGFEILLIRDENEVAQNRCRKGTPAETRRQSRERVTS